MSSHNVSNSLITEMKPYQVQSSLLYLSMQAFCSSGLGLTQLKKTMPAININNLNNKNGIYWTKKKKILIWLVQFEQTSQI